jgi:Tol biopolymer transport system component
MSRTPETSRLAWMREKTLESVFVLLLESVLGLLFLWVTSHAVPAFGGLFRAAWGFLTSPVPVPKGLLLVVSALAATYPLVSVLRRKVVPGMRPVWAVSLIAAAVALVVVVVSAGLYYAFRSGEPAGAPQIRKLTQTRNVAQAAISPDGRYFVFSADEGNGQQSLHLGQVDASVTVQVQPPAPVRYVGLAFSPDGLHVYFARYEGNSLVGDLYEMASLGGQARQIKSGLPRFFNYTLAPDGKSLAFVRDDPARGESVLVEGSTSRLNEEHPVAALKAPRRFIGVPAWSPDGQVLTCAVAEPGADKARGDEVRMAWVTRGTGKVALDAPLEWSFIRQVSSLSNDSGLVLLGTKIYGPFQIWRVPYGGQPERITNDLSNYDGMSLTADSGALLTIEDNLTDGVWVVPSDAPDRPRQIVQDVGRHNDFWGFSWTRDGRILYVSTKGGNQDIWVMNPDGTGERQLTFEGDNFDPCVTADGRQIVFTSKRGDSYDIWQMGAEGGEPVRLTSGNRDFAPNCSPAGPWVVYTSERDGQWTLWKVGLGGGQPEQLTHRPSQWPAVSPDGSRVACFYMDEHNVLVLAVIPVQGGEPKTFPIPPSISTWAELRWIRDGQELTYVDTRDGVSNIWSIPAGGGKPRQLTQFDSGRIFRYEWSRDGRALVLSRGSVARDVVLIKLKGK